MSTKTKPAHKAAPATRSVGVDCDCPLCAKYGETPNAATAAAIREVEAGRVTRFSSPKKLFASWGK